MNFFPVFALYLIITKGKPIIIQEGRIKENKLINIEQSTPVLMIGFSEKSDLNQIQGKLPRLYDVSKLDTADILFLAEPYLDEKLK